MPGELRPGPVGREPRGQTVAKRAATGGALLASQTVVTGVITALGGILLARLLTPKEFGVYAIVAFVATFFSLFSDVGLGAAIIQQRKYPTREELTTVFTLQMVLSGSLVVAAVAAANPISLAYHLPPGGVWLIRVLLLSIPIGMVRSVPSILLERDLSYGRLSVIESTEALSFQVVAVILAYAQFGVWSFVWATVARAVLGVIVAYVMAPWWPGFGLSRGTASRFLRFGLPYQLQRTLMFARNSLTPSVVAVLAGAAAVGYVNWALALAATPLVITNIVWRVTFPAFSRAQDDPVLLRTMIERSIRLSAIAFLPASCLLMAAAPQIVRYIYLDKWTPALAIFYLFSVSNWTAPLTGIFSSAIYSAGRPRVNLYLTILGGILDWAIGVPLVLTMGFGGVGVRSVLVTYLTLPIIVIATRRVVLPTDALRQVARAAIAAVSASFLEFILLRVLPPGVVELLAAGVASAIFYLTLIAVLERRVLGDILHQVLPMGMQPAFAWYALDRRGKAEVA